MKRKIIIALLAFILSFSITGCITIEKVTDKEVEKSQNEEPKEKVYIEESQVAELFTSPDKFKGNYVKLDGQVLIDPEKSDGEVALQVWTDPINSDQSFIVYCKKDCGVKINDYVKIDGKILGAFDGETILGADLSVPMLETESVEVSSYIDVIAPTLKEISPKISGEQHGFTVSVDKIEYSDIETRVYMTATNKGKESLVFDYYGIRIIQDGKQIEQDMDSSSTYEGDYPMLSDEISSGASSSGILVFPPIDQTKSFQVVVPNTYSDNYELEFKDYTLDIKVQ